MVKESPEYLYECFMKALEYEAAKKGRGGRAYLATAAGISNAYVTQIFKREKSASFTKQVELSRSLGYTFEEFLGLGRSLVETGKPPATRQADSFFPTRDIESSPLVILAPSNWDPEHFRRADEEFFGIPLYETGKLAAGGNGVMFDPYEEPASMVVVPRPELPGCSRHRLAALRVGGDSMEPLIGPHSVIVIDLDDRERVEGKIYAVATRSGDADIASVKRIRTWDAGNGFVLVSENPKYPPVISYLDWPELCLGRAVWMWRNIRNQ